MTTYSDFQNKPSSVKIGLVKLEAAQRLTGWTLYSGSVYIFTDFPSVEIISIVDGLSGTTYTASASIAGVTAGKYFLDTDKTLYIRTSDSTHPNGKFIACTYSLFFSNVSTIAPYDLSTGREVLWTPLLDSTSDFGLGLDNEQLGVAIDGSGTIKFVNDQTYWSDKYDAIYFENQRAFIYSWSTDLPITEAKIIYRGRVESKSWDKKNVTFKLKDVLNELKTMPELTNLEDIVGARIPDNLLKAKKRLVYGRVFGHRLVSIDQVLSGYPITGTLGFTNASKTVTGSGTSFLTQLSPEDVIIIPGNENQYTIDSVDSNTQITLTEEYEEDTQSGVSVTIDPSHPKRYINRDFVICGNQIREPSTTVINGINLLRFRVASTQDLRAGDEIIVAGELTTIDTISGNIIKTTNSLIDIPSPGDSVVRTGVTNVTLDSERLIFNRDYTYDTATGLLTLDTLAEYNIAPIQAMQGTVDFTSTSRDVTGTNTIFTAQLKVGDWIRSEGQATFYEILEIISDTELTLRSAAGYTTSTTAQRKVVNVYNDQDSVLTCDLLGKSDDGTPDGNLLENAPSIVEDLLSVAGLSDIIHTSSFTDAKALSGHAVGIVIPEKYSDTNPKTFKDYIKQINQSVFGSLYQTSDFDLGYSLLDPRRPESSLLLDEKDILGFSITSDGKDLSAIISLEYLFKEYDHLSQGPSNSVSEFTSLEGIYLAKSNKIKIIKTVLSFASSATIFSGRWSMLLERARSELKLSTKMQPSRTNITDTIRVKHEKLFNRVGLVGKQKMGLVSSLKKDLNGVTLEFDDLGNVFSRVSTITENDSVSYSAASEDEKIINGYVTDQYGLVEDNRDTIFNHKIW